MTILDDYARFHKLALETHDVDPVYPVLRGISDELGWDEERRTWAVLAHVAYYDLGSALQAIDADKWLPGLTFGTERRNHRVPARFEKHWTALEHKSVIYAGFYPWLRDALVPGDPVASWGSVTDALLDVWGNGRWAAYKTCEMLAEVVGMPLEAPDMGHAHSSGPRQGLNLLFAGANQYTGNDKGTVKLLDDFSTLLCKVLAERGLPARVENVETTLCDFHALHGGRYYVGHDIDQMLEQLHHSPDNTMKFAAFQARSGAFDEAYLGERGGWDGIDKSRNKAYKEHGLILTRGSL